MPPYNSITSDEGSSGSGRTAAECNLLGRWLGRGDHEEEGGVNKVEV